MCPTSSLTFREIIETELPIEIYHPLSIMKIFPIFIDDLKPTAPQEELFMDTETGVLERKDSVATSQMELLSTTTAKTIHQVSNRHSVEVSALIGVVADQSSVSLDRERESTFNAEYVVADTNICNEPEKYLTLKPVKIIDPFQTKSVSADDVIRAPTPTSSPERSGIKNRTPSIGYGIANGGLFHVRSQSNTSSGAGGSIMGTKLEESVRSVNNEEIKESRGPTLISQKRSSKIQTREETQSNATDSPVLKGTVLKRNKTLSRTPKENALDLDRESGSQSNTQGSNTLGRKASILELDSMIRNARISASHKDDSFQEMEMILSQMSG